MSYKLLFALFFMMLMSGCASVKVYDDAVYNRSNVWADMDRLVSRDFASHQSILKKSLLKIWQRRADEEIGRASCRERV